MNKTFRAFAILILTFFSSSIYSRNLSDSLKRTTVTDPELPGNLIYDTDNKILLNNQLNDATQGISTTETVIKKLSRYQNKLNIYAASIDDLTGYDSFEKTPYASWNNTSETKKKDGEEALITCLLTFNFEEDDIDYYASADQTAIIYEDIINAGNFSISITEELRKITTTSEFNDFNDIHHSRYRSSYRSYNPFDITDITPNQLIYYSNTEQKYNYLKDLATRIKELKTTCKRLIMQETSRIGDEINASEKLNNAYTKKQADIYNKLNNESEQLSNRAINIGIPCFSGTIIILFLGFWLIRMKSIQNNNGSNSSSDSPKVALAIGTVFLLTTTILILGLAKLLSPEVLGTLIGGISAYVLNNINKIKREPPTSPSSKETPNTPPPPTQISGNPQPSNQLVENSPNPEPENPNPDNLNPVG